MGTVQSLKDTGAGTDAVTDTEGHFTKATTEEIIGSENTAMLKGDSAAGSSANNAVPPYKCYIHGGNNMPMYSKAGCEAVAADANFAGAQARYENTYGECLKKQGALTPGTTAVRAARRPSRCTPRKDSNPPKRLRISPLYGSLDSHDKTLASVTTLVSI